MRESELWRKCHSFVHGMFEQQQAVKAAVFIERRGMAWLEFLKPPWKEQIYVSSVVLLSPFRAHWWEIGPSTIEINLISASDQEETLCSCLSNK